MILSITDSSFSQYYASTNLNATFTFVFNGVTSTIDKTLAAGSNSLEFILPFYYTETGSVTTSVILKFTEGISTNVAGQATGSSLTIQTRPTPAKSSISPTKSTNPKVSTSTRSDSSVGGAIAAGVIVPLVVVGGGGITVAIISAVVLMKKKAAALAAKEISFATHYDVELAEGF